MSKEKRMAGSYEIEQSIYIGEKEVLFGVNKAEEYPFMVCYCSYNNPLSARGVRKLLVRTIIWKRCRCLQTEYRHRSSL